VWSNIRLVYLKDLKETLRDRRTMVRLLLVSVVWIPVVGHFFATYNQGFREESERAQLRIAIAGAEHLPQLAAAYSQEAGFQRVEPAPGQTTTDGIRAGQIDVALEIPAAAGQQVQAGQQVNIRVHYNNADSKQQIILERATLPITQLSERQRDWRLTLLGVAGGAAKENMLYPVVREEIEAASRRAVIGQRYGGMISYFAFLICFLGCTFAALDVGVGEKERGTLESLLLLPAPRRDLVLGKYLVVVTMGVVYSTLLLLSLAGWLRLEALGSSGITDELLELVAPMDLLLVWLMLLPIAAFFAALLLALSVYARSFKEATSLTGVSNLLLIVAVVFAALPGAELTWTWAMVPITSVALAIRELLKGTMDYAMLAIILGSSTVLAAVLLTWCTRLFEREAVVFRE
jgi:sodium transport system permease protein